jgi:hypothetical protein
VNIRHLNIWYLPCGSFSGSLVSSAIHPLDRLSSFRMKKDPFIIISYLFSDYLFSDIV